MRYCNLSHAPLEFKIILIINLLIGFFLVHPSDNRFTKSILSLLILANVLFLINFTTAQITGLTIYLFALVLIMIYGMKTKDMLTGKRWLIVLSAFFVFTKHIFAIQHWPGGTLLNLLMILPIAFYCFLLLGNGKMSKNELGFMTMITGDAIFSFIRWITIDP